MVRSTRYFSAGVENRLNDCGAETIILLDEYLPLLQVIQSRTSVKNVITVNLGGKIKAPRMNGGNVLDYDALLEGMGTEAPPHFPNPANDAALIHYTGGTSGVSKGVMLTHFNLVANTLQVRETLAAACCRGQDRILVTLPLFHAYGMTLGMNLAVSIAGTQILLPRFDAGAVLKQSTNTGRLFSRYAPYVHVAAQTSPAG